MLLTLIIGIAIGAALGAILGRYVGLGCSGGSCPVAGNPWAGVIAGAALGALVAMFIANRAPSPQMQAYRAIPEITSQQQFEQEVLKSSQPVVVDFFATWCRPCKRLAPTIGELSQEFEGKATFYKVDGDKSGDLMRAYRLNSYPTILIFKPGQASPQMLVGLRGIDEYRQALK